MQAFLQIVCGLLLPVSIRYMLEPPHQGFNIVPPGSNQGFDIVQLGPNQGFNIVQPGPYQGFNIVQPGEANSARLLELSQLAGVVLLGTSLLGLVFIWPIVHTVACSSALQAGS